MIPDGSNRAVIDRIEDDFAVLEVTSPEDELHELVVSPDELSSEGRHADAVLTVRVADNSLVEAVYQPEETQGQKEQAEDRFDRLANRPLYRDNKS
jgi:hypothetical protein